MGGGLHGWGSGFRPSAAQPRSAFLPHSYTTFLYDIPTAFLYIYIYIWHAFLYIYIRHSYTAFLYGIPIRHSWHHASTMIFFARALL